MRLALREWGEGEPLACLHGVTGTGSHFARLAGLLPGRRVLAPDLRGHGDSGWEPPWNLETFVADVLETVPAGVRAWLGHSFGGRLAYEIAAAVPERVERLILLDPAILLPPHVGLQAAEQGRADRSYASVEEAIERRYEESLLVSTPRELLEEELPERLVRSDDGRWRYRYCQSAVVAAYGEMTREPPPFERVRVPTLLVLGAQSYVPYDHLLAAHRAALGDLLEVVAVAGGHTVLWDALEQTAAAVARFLA